MLKLFSSKFIGQAASDVGKTQSSIVPAPTVLSPPLLEPQHQLQELESRESQLLTDIASIKEQLARARAQAHTAGIYSDSHWYQSAQRALRHKQAAHQAVLKEASSLRRQLRQVRQQAFEEAFVSQARQLLPPVTFMEIMNRANRVIDPA